MESDESRCKLYSRFAPLESGFGTLSGSSPVDGPVFSLCC